MPLKGRRVSSTNRNLFSHLRGRGLSFLFAVITPCHTSGVMLNVVVAALVPLLALATSSEVLISPWSTEPLSWSTPENVTVFRFNKNNPLPLPLPYSIVLRVSSKAMIVSSQL